MFAFVWLQVQHPAVCCVRHSQSCRLMQPKLLLAEVEVEAEANVSVEVEWFGRQTTTYTVKGRHQSHKSLASSAAAAQSSELKA